MAKRLQFEHGVVSADLAALVAAAISIPADQQPLEDLERYRDYLRLTGVGVEEDQRIEGGASIAPHRIGERAESPRQIIHRQPLRPATRSRLRYRKCSGATAAIKQRPSGSVAAPKRRTLSPSRA